MFYDKNIFGLIFKTFVCLAILSTVSNAADVILHKTPGSDFPIAMAVEIPPDATVVNLSGAVPTIINPNATKGSVEAYGNTEEQTISSLESIEKTLKSLGLEMGDIIKMQVFLVGDPKLFGKMDFDGFMNGYRKFFGTKEQPNLPTRSVFQVTALANPAWFVEIEVTAVRKVKK
ncbi:MAG: RidA family protein [Campylobacteraceae bacterium]|jgi:enamine deaminase RidA (YjgF/YER057c/UK114 family)|nr:RidA family protein [Campylobacteraceae bacterium]